MNPNRNLLLLHGALGSQSHFDTLKTHLSIHYNVFTLNFEGHGGRTCTREFTIDGFTENVVDFLNENDIEKAHIFGYSMGGYVALHLASLHPERVLRIMTLGTKFDWTPESAGHEAKMLNPDKIQEKIPAFAKQLQERHAPNDWKELLSKTAALMLDLGNGKRLSNDQLSQIENKILISIGSLDNMVSKEESADAADHLPNGEFKIIDQFKHPIEKVDVNQLSEIIIEFIQGP